MLLTGFPNYMVVSDKEARELQEEDENAGFMEALESYMKLHGALWAYSTQASSMFWHA